MFECGVVYKNPTTSCEYEGNTAWYRHVGNYKRHELEGGNKFLEQVLLAYVHFNLHSRAFITLHAVEPHKDDAFRTSGFHPFVHRHI